MSTFILMAFGLALVLGIIFYAYADTSSAKAQRRRIESMRERHSSSSEVKAQAHLKRITAAHQTKIDSVAQRLIPKPALLRLRLEKTGKSWTLAQYGMVSLGLVIFTLFLLLMRGFPMFMALMIALFVGIGLPHMRINKLIRKRGTLFTAKFPDAIDLMVRGLRSGLPITETMSIVSTEIGGPVGEEFRAVVDKMRIGRTMEAALQDTADRLAMPEIQFFVITLAIQRETGGNLAETLNNLSEVLRKRAAMRLKIKAMSSEAKASAWIIGILPFAVFAIISFMNWDYMSKFFSDERLMIAGGGGLVWMGIGVFIMSRMINFEI